MRKRRETPVVQDIGDIMLARVGELALMAKMVFPFKDSCLRRNLSSHLWLNKELGCVFPV